MKLHIGSGRLQGDIDPFHLDDQASIEWLRSDRSSKATRHGRGRGASDDEDGDAGRHGKTHGRRQHREVLGGHHGRR